MVVSYGRNSLISFSIDKQRFKEQMEEIPGGGLSETQKRKKCSPLQMKILKFAIIQITKRMSLTHPDMELQTRVMGMKILIRNL